MSFKSFWTRANTFVQAHFLALVLIGGAGYWVLSNQDRPMPLEDGGMAMEGAEIPKMSLMRARSRGNGKYGGVAMDMAASFVPPITNDFDPSAKDRKIVRNGSLTVEVEDTEAARSQVETSLKKLGGFVVSLNSWESRPGVLAYNLSLRIPADRLDDAIEMFSNLGIKKSENVSSRDITAQYTDNQERLKTLMARRSRLRTMMDRKTKNLGDVLQIDRELSNVQMQIENLERGLKRQDRNVDYSSLQLSLQPQPEIGDFSRPAEWNPSRSWKAAVNDLIYSVRGLFDLGVRLVAYSPLWGPVLAVLWWWSKRKPAKKK